MAVTNCPQCGAPVIPGSIFCDDCGTDLRSSAQFTSTQMNLATAGGVLGGNETGEQPGVCPVCGHTNRSGAIFCENCGVRLASAPPTPAPTPLAIEPLPAYQPPIAASLKPALAYLYLPAGMLRLDFPSGKSELIVGREDAISGIFPEINLEPYGAQEAGVSRRHLRLVNSGGTWLAEDLNTVNGTFVNRQRLPGGQPVALRSGDELQLGKLAIIFNLE